MISKEMFETTRKRGDFWNRLCDAWENTRSKLIEDFPNRPGRKLEDYRDAGFTDLRSLEDKEYLFQKSGVARSTGYNFLGRKPVSLENLDKIIGVFEPLVAADSIWNQAFPSQERYHSTVLTAFDDGPARALAERHFEGNPFPRGAVVELRQFGDIVSSSALHRPGIPPEDIQLHALDLEFRLNRSDRDLFDEEKFRELKQLEAEGRKSNGVKLSLAKVEPQDVLDEGRKVALTVKNTDHFTLMACLSAIGDVEDDLGRVVRDRSKERSRYADLSPSANKVPNSFCLHYILRFGDGNFLAIHRHAGMAYEKLKVSVSGEEQLSVSDFAVPSSLRVKHWINRAYLEEVVPGRNLSQESADGKDLLSYIEWARCLSLVYEERFCGYAMICLIQLAIDTEEYTQGYRDGLMKANKPDWEGNRYWFDSARLGSFFRVGQLGLTPFNSLQPPITVKAERLVEPSENVFALHASSLYRLFLAGKIAGVL